ncbi:MAG TPA: DNA polymerase IV [Pseudomonadales bacterium]|nr:DNA polymerase IV [Pseudomonadales bacterium]
MTAALPITATSPRAHNKAVRKIIHVDCDCFYASVEMLDDPSLKGRPIAVGGSAAQRGVISTCNYEARAFGVRSAMPTGQAQRLCKDLVLIYPRFDRYKQIAKQVHAIFRDYTDQIEPLSLDEAYLDVSNAECCKSSATLIAQEIRARIKKEVGITASAGVAPNKFVAKIASDWNKPDGLFVVKPDQVMDFVADLDVAKLPGVGKVTADRLYKLGLRNCRDIRAWSRVDLCRRLGSLGDWLYFLARGEDHRAVHSRSERKSLSVEHTFAQDLPGTEHALRALEALIPSLQERLNRSAYANYVHKTFVKVKFKDFSQTTAECVNLKIDSGRFKELVMEALSRKNMPIRLLGVGVRFSAFDAQQLSLF